MNVSAGFEDVGTGRILLEKVELGRFTPRKTFSQRYVDELVKSIEREGQYKPIIVRLHPLKKDMFEVVDGEHRVRALRKLDRLYVRAEVRVLSDKESDILAMRVNQIHGKKLNALEEGLHIEKLIERYSCSQEEVGERFGRSQQWVSQRLKLVRNTCDKLIEAFTTHVVGLSKVREIAELSEKAQLSVLDKVTNEQLSFRETETLVHAIKEQPDRLNEILTIPINRLTPPPPDIEDFEEEHGPEKPKYEECTCPRCGTTIVINWVLQRYNWRVE